MFLKKKFLNLQAIQNDMNIYLSKFLKLKDEEKGLWASSHKLQSLGSEESKSRTQTSPW